ncbi:MAG: Na+/H+ antiporter subunit E [Tyzzerella sp.]|nr:Na+/H+ antiporter subunit E [Tyzzerella sp.]
MYLLFFLAWIIFNGKVTVEITILGIVIAALVFAFVCKFMDYSLQKEKDFYKKIMFLLAYVVLLVKEIIIANLAVIHLVLARNEVVEPIIVKFRTNLRSETLRVILANSITLTPGTITVSLEEDELTVHCLDKSLAEGMEDSMFVKMLEKMERRG